MLRRLKLDRFKNFLDAELSMGPFTLLVGANAAGKSNVREALRFLHGVGRRYTLAEIFGGRWSAGERQWEGIRGGARETSFRGAESFAIEVEMEGPSTSDPWIGREMRFVNRFHIEVETRLLPLLAPRVVKESLRSGEDQDFTTIYDSHPIDSPLEQKHADQIAVRILHKEMPRRAWLEHTFSSDCPVISQLLKRDDARLSYVESSVLDTLHQLSSMRFIEPSPAAMRNPSAPGQHVLSDHGENLSSVLQSLCADEARKAELIRWLRMLTPMDVADLRFARDLRGEVLLVVVEKDGTELSAYSASEGTLRFLAMLASLLAADGGVYFFEEIENGLHPSRLRLLLDLIRTRTASGEIQVVATTHSPMLLSLLDEAQLPHAFLVYRLEGEPSGRITRLLDVPDAARVLAEHDRADLLASGWFEDMVELASVPREPLKEVPAEESRS